MRLVQGVGQRFPYGCGDVNEFINRPKDISYVIDELERRNQGTLDGNLNLGTGLELLVIPMAAIQLWRSAGATIDFDYLEKRCNLPFARWISPSCWNVRPCGCRATATTSGMNGSQAIYAYNPVNRDIFGPKGIGEITIPILLASGSYDFAAPPALEQTTSFTWLRAPDKYWMLLEGQAHVNFDEIDPGIKKSLEAVTNLELSQRGTDQGLRQEHFSGLFQGSYRQ